MASLDSSKGLGQSRKHRETTPSSPPYHPQGLATYPCPGTKHDNDLLASLQETQMTGSPYSWEIGNPAGTFDSHRHSRPFLIGGTAVFPVSDRLGVGLASTASDLEGVVEPGNLGPWGMS